MGGEIDLKYRQELPMLNSLLAQLCFTLPILI